MSSASTESWFNSVAIAILGAFLSLIVGGLLFYANTKQRTAAAIAEAHTKLIGRVVELEKNLALVNQAVVPISAAFQAILIKDLTHFHTPEMDNLLAKIGPPLTLTAQEAARLEVLLAARARDVDNLISEQERDAARMLPMVMRRVLADRDMTGMEAEPLVRMIVTQQVAIDVKPSQGADIS